MVFNGWYTDTVEVFRVTDVTVGHIKKLNIEEVDPEDYFVINVDFTLICTYNTNCETNEEYMNSIEKSFKKEAEES